MAGQRLRRDAHSAVRSYPSVAAVFHSFFYRYNIFTKLCLWGPWNINHIPKTKHINGKKQKLKPTQNVVDPTENANGRSGGRGYTSQGRRNSLSYVFPFGEALTCSQKKLGVRCSIGDAVYFRKGESDHARERGGGGGGQARRYQGD